MGMARIYYMLYAWITRIAINRDNIAYLLYARIYYMLYVWITRIALYVWITRNHIYIYVICMNHYIYIFIHLSDTPSPSKKQLFVGVEVFRQEMSWGYKRSSERRSRTHGAQLARRPPGCQGRCNGRPSEIVGEKVSRQTKADKWNCRRQVSRWEVGGWGRDPQKCTGRDWGMGSTTI